MRGEPPNSSQHRTATAAPTSAVTVPSFGFGIKPFGPRIYTANTPRYHRVSVLTARAHSIQAVRTGRVWSPLTRATRPTRGIMSGVAMHLVKLMFPAVMAATRSSAPTTVAPASTDGTRHVNGGDTYALHVACTHRHAPAFRASSALSFRANTAIATFLPFPYGSWPPKRYKARGVSVNDTT